jgi:tetratricopeptide (TPR) repeat protein
VSEDVSGAFARASHYLDIDRPQSALDALTELGGGALEDAHFWELQTQALLDLERFDQARRAAEEGLRLDADSLALLAMAAAAEARLGVLDEAERHLLAALRLEPESTFLLASYADVLMQGGAVAKASRVLERADRIDPDDPAVIRARITLAYISNKDREAERQSRRLLAEVDPEDPYGHAMLGAQASNRGSFRRASEHFDTAARHDLSDEDAVGLARIGRVEAHPLFWPLWPIQRFGPAKLWVAAIGTFALLRAAGLEEALVVLLPIYLVWIAYTWIVPPLARRWLERGS